jgi:hypothetical protein
MANPYYILYNPPTFNFMDLFGKCTHPNELLSFSSGRDANRIDDSNYLNYLEVNPAMHRRGMADALAIECYTLEYIGHMIARCGAKAKIILADGKRRTLDHIIRAEGNRPAAVFITAMSANFPAAVAAALALNHGKIPVIIGGIHVSTCQADVGEFLLKHAPLPQLIAQVHGPADTANITQILKDLGAGRLKGTYTGRSSLEDGIWGYENVVPLPPHRLELLRKIPLVGNLMVRKVSINTAAPYIGCPFSCRFCSISTLPKGQRSFSVRDPGDFVNELKSRQKGGVNSRNRFFFLVPDNLLLGAKKLDEILDRMIAERLIINFATQISIEVASRERLLRKLRKAGATHFFIGFESLDLRNLEYIGKNVSGDIKSSGESVAAYYRSKIRKIQRSGISIHGAFIFGLPYDYFNTLHDHTGVDVARFCIENHIGLQPSVLTDLPGSLNFRESQQSKRYLYGKQGSWEYLVGLCTADLGETNRIPFDALHKSPLLPSYLAYEAIERVGARRHALKSAIIAMLKAMGRPTRNGAASVKGRLEDGFWALFSQLSVSLYKDHTDMLGHTSNGNRGIFERLYNGEQNPQIKKLFGRWVSQFTQRSDSALPQVRSAESGKLKQTADKQRCRH